MKKILVLIILSLFAFDSDAQISFFKLFSNSGYDFGQGVVQLADSSYAICGSSSSFEDAPADAFLLRLDSLGNFLWSKHYGGEESESAKRVLYKENVGYFLAGFTNSYGNSYDFYLVKTDEDGNQLWEKNYGTSGWEKVNDALLTTDTNVILVGQSIPDGLNSEIFIVKVDQQGDTLWTKTIGTAGEDIATSIDFLNDSVYVVAGQKYLEDSLQVKPWIMFLKDDGTVLSEQLLSCPWNAGFNDVEVESATGKINVAGWAYNASASINNALKGRFSLNGILDYYEIAVSSTDDVSFDFVTSYGSQGKHFMVYQYIVPTSFQDAYDLAITRTDQGLYWESNAVLIAFQNEDAAGQIIPTSDGGAICVGYTGYFGEGGGNVFVVKIGPSDLYPTVPVVPDVESLLAIDELTDNESAVSVYPNPASTTIHVTSAFSGQIIGAMYSNDGKLIWSDTFSMESSIDVSNLPGGFYYIHLADENGHKLIRKIVVHE